MNKRIFHVHGPFCRHAGKDMGISLGILGRCLERVTVFYGVDAQSKWKNYIKQQCLKEDIFDNDLMESSGIFKGGKFEDTKNILKRIFLSNEVIINPKERGKNDIYTQYL